MYTTITPESEVHTSQTTKTVGAVKAPSKTPTKGATKTSKSSKGATMPVATLPDDYTRHDRAKLGLHAATGVPMHLALNSSAVSEATWRPLSQTLEVRYASGSRYRYIGVSKAVVRGLLAAPSKGRYLAKQVRPLPYQRLG